jgi:hypothetical protein
VSLSHIVSKARETVPLSYYNKHRNELLRNDNE